MSVSFKDFTPVQYTGGESEMQDRYAYKRRHGVVGEAEQAGCSDTIMKIRGRLRENREKKSRERSERHD